MDKKVTTLSEDFSSPISFQKIFAKNNPFQIYLHFGLQFQTFGFSFTNIQTF